MTDQSLVNIGELAKPATTLIERISDSIGGVCKPWQIKRIARAETEAEIIKAAGEIEISKLHERAMQRFVAEEAKKQQNIESITRKAIPLLENDADPSQMDEDWIVNFFDRCRLVSDDEMQNLWAKILAGEANQPGRFSRKTIMLLDSIDKKDAQMFTDICGFLYGFEEYVDILIYSYKDEIYKENGVDFEVLSHLGFVGLIQYLISGEYMQDCLYGEFNIHYFDTRLHVNLDRSEHDFFVVGKCQLTQAGKELAPICGAGKVSGFLEYVLERWTGLGYIVSTSPV